MDWEVVIGLEVHAQLATKSKMFSAAATAYGALPNTQVSFLDAALPGTLPVVNREAVAMAVRFGLAVEASIQALSVFERKNYFYPDLPKGYQISQFETPIVAKGFLDINTDAGTKRIGITRAHLEEDAGKSLHEEFHGETGIDLNRAGTPLLEIVSEPDLRSASEAVAYLKKLHALVRYLEICDGNMQEGSFRCDANISVRRFGTPLGTRNEIKNLNSFKFVEKAILYEVERQIEVLEAGGKIIQMTRLYDPDKNETRPLRSKEEAHDYRYFPDPDLLPLQVTEALLSEVKATLPELPEAKKIRFVEQYQLPEYDAAILTATRDMAAFFEDCAAQTEASAKIVANWLMGDVSAFLNKDALEIQQSPVSTKQLADLLNRLTDGTLSGKMAKELFEALWNQEGEVDTLIAAKGLSQLSDPIALQALIDEIMAQNPKQLEQYRAGKDKLFGFFVGQAMKKSEGRANPDLLNTLLKASLDQPKAAS